MKKASVSILVIFFIALAAPQATAGERVMKLGTVAPDHSSFHKILLRMRDDWRNEGVRLTIYPGGVAGGEAEMVRRMRTGGLDAALLTVNGLSEIDPSVEALQNLPMMFRTLEEVDYVNEKLRARLERTLRAKGFVVLFWADAGWVRFFSTRPVETPDQMRRLKLFTWAGDMEAIDVYRTAGFNVVPLETADIASSLQTGLIDAVPMPPYVALATQTFRKAPHMLDITWAPLVGALVVTERSWNRLEPDSQRLLARTAAAAGTEMKQTNRLECDAAIAAMKSRGLVVVHATPAVEQQWRDAAERSYGVIRGRMVPADLFDEVRSLLHAYRAHEVGR